MPDVHVADSTWIGASATAVGAVISDRRNWALWWPELGLELAEARGAKGVRWTVDRAPGRMTGSMEIWLQPTADGVLAHYYLRLDRAHGVLVRPARRERIVRRYRARAKRVLWAVTDVVDPGRMARIAAPPDR